MTANMTQDQVLLLLSSFPGAILFASSENQKLFKMCLYFLLNMSILRKTDASCSQLNIS